jgi:hypothetical protein
MKGSRFNRAMLFLALGVIATAIIGCAGLQTGPKGTLTLKPDQIVIAPELLKSPVVFSGSGFGPKEVIVVELALPKGVTVKGVPAGDNAALGTGTSDEKGAFQIKMEGMTALNTLFQVGWTPLIKPDFAQAKPLPPGTYDVIATGMMTETVGKAKLTILPPPPKKE